MDFMNIAMTRLDTNWQPLNSETGRILVSNVFDVTEHVKYRTLNNSKNRTPFTYFVKLGELIIHPLKQDNSQVGFPTRAEASTHREQFITECIANKGAFADMVGLVLRNSDMTEGRGPMVYDSVWASLETAYDYIRSHKGGFVSGMTTQFVSYGCNINNDTYAHISYGNGEYDLVAMPIKQSLDDKREPVRF